MKSIFGKHDKFLFVRGPDEQLKPKSASSLRYAVKAARLDYTARVKDKIRAVERLYLEELMATHDAVAGLEAFIAKRPPQWLHR